MVGEKPFPGSTSLNSPYTCITCIFGQWHAFRVHFCFNTQLSVYSKHHCSKCPKIKKVTAEGNYNFNDGINLVKTCWIRFRLR